MYDAIIVGARCAGAATAMLLARRGHKVLLVDRATFPSDLPHGHFIHRRGPARLKRWGLLGRVAATGAPPITSVTTDYGDFALSDRDVMVDGAPLVPRVAGAPWLFDPPLYHWIAAGFGALLPRATEFPSAARFASTNSGRSPPRKASARPTSRPTGTRSRPGPRTRKATGCWAIPARSRSSCRRR